MNSGADELTLAARHGSFRLEHVLTYSSRRAGELVDRAEDGSYRRLFDADGTLMLAEARQAEGALLLQAQSTDGRAFRVEQLTHIVHHLPWAWGLDENPEPALQRLGEDPVLAPLLAAYSGLRLIGTPAPFEALVWAVLGQQISLQVAFRLKAALVKHRGTPADFGGRTYWTFPSPEAIVSSDEATLAELGLGRRKAATITGAARALLEGQINFDELALLPLPEAEESLTRLPGVGPWTAHYTLLRGLRRLDACPVSDLGLRAACGALYGFGRTATALEVEQLAARWVPYRGVAAFYLWFHLASQSSRGS